MNLIQIKYLVPILILGLFSFSSCEKKDVDAPVIEYVRLNQNVDTNIIHLDSTLETTFYTTDNKGVISYRTSIYNNFTFLAPSKSNLSYSSYITGELNGELSDSLTVYSVINDSSLAGPYFSTVETVDDEGNVSDKETRHFRVFREDAPTIDLVSPNFGSPLSINLSDSLIIEANLFDNENTTSFEVRIAENANMSTKINKVLYFSDTLINRDLTGTNQIKLGVTGISIGEHPIFFIVKDNTGNVVFHQNTIIIN